MITSKQVPKVTCVLQTWNIFRRILKYHIKKILCKIKALLLKVSVQFSHTVMSNSATPWTAVLQASLSFTISQSFPDGTVVKNLPANAGDARDMGSIPGSGRCPGVGNGNPLQYSCLENPMDREVWQAIVTKDSDMTQWLSTCVSCTHLLLPMWFSHWVTSDSVTPWIAALQAFSSTASYIWLLIIV